MINTNAFDYINVLDKAADASWLRNEAIANNIANVDTPNYKRQDVAFESELRKALGYNRYQTMDDKVSHVKTSRLQPQVYTDYGDYAYRLDGKTDGIIMNDDPVQRQQRVADQGRQRNDHSVRYH